MSIKSIAKVNHRTRLRDATHHTETKSAKRTRLTDEIRNTLDHTRKCIIKLLTGNVRHIGYKKIAHSQPISAGRTTAPTPDRRNGLLSSKSSGDSSLKCRLLPRFSRSSSNAKHFWTYSATTPLRRPLPKLDRHRGVDPIAKGDDHIEVAMTSRHIRHLPNIFVCGKGFLHRWRLFLFPDLRIAQTK